MNLKSLLTTTIGVTTLNSVVPNLFNQTTKKNSDNDTIAQIAQKYQSATVDLTTINYQNFYNDINNSTLKDQWNKTFNISFDITKTSQNANSYITYNNKQAGSDSQIAYQAKIKSDTMNVMTNFAILIIISDIAHYYGDNTAMDAKIRIAAIVKDLAIIDQLVNNLNNSVLPIAKNGSFAQKLNTWKSNLSQLISDVMNRSYDNDPLLSSYNKINYNQLQTSNATMHKCDDWTASDQPWKIAVKPLDKKITTITDGFIIGSTTNPNLFQITLKNNLTFWWENNSDISLTHVDHFAYWDPTNYDLNI